MTSLRQYLPGLVAACLLFTALSLVKIYAFAPAPFQAHDTAVFWWMVGGWERTPCCLRTVCAGHNGTAGSGFTRAVADRGSNDGF